MKPLRVTRAGVLGSLLVLLVAGTCVRLGFWQLHRLAQRRARNAVIAQRMREAPLRLTRAALDTAGLPYRWADAAGTWDGPRSIVLAGRSYNGEPGVYLLTPLLLDKPGNGEISAGAGSAGAGAVLVNRGWLPSADAATVELQPFLGQAPAAVHGMLLHMPIGSVPPSAGFRRTWYRIDPAALAAQLPYPVLPLLLQVAPGPADRGFPRPVAPPALDEGPHFSYAIQWFSFATIGVAGWIALLLRGRKDDEDEELRAPDA